MKYRVIEYLTVNGVEIDKLMSSVDIEKAGLEIKVLFDEGDPTEISVEPVLEELDRLEKEGGKYQGSSLDLDYHDYQVFEELITLSCRIGAEAHYDLNGVLEFVCGYVEVDSLYYTRSFEDGQIDSYRHVKVGTPIQIEFIDYEDRVEVLFNFGMIVNTSTFPKQGPIAEEKLEEMLR